MSTWGSSLLTTLFNDGNNSKPSPHPAKAQFYPRSSLTPWHCHTGSHSTYCFQVWMTSPSSSTWDNFPVVFEWRIWTKIFQNSKFLLWQWMLPVVFLGNGLPLFTAHLEDLKCCFVCVKASPSLTQSSGAFWKFILSVEIVKVKIVKVCSGSGFTQCHTAWS